MKNDAYGLMNFDESKQVCSAGDQTPICNMREDCCVDVDCLKKDGELPKYIGQQNEPVPYNTPEHYQRELILALNELSDESLKESNEELPEGFIFKKIREFFTYLFIDDSNGKSLDNRRFIIITRRGFSLIHVGMLCGFTGENPLVYDRLISDRCWNKMTTYERNEFVAGKDVYIVDDSVITGISAQSIYYSIGVRDKNPTYIDPRKGLAKSLSVAFLTSEYNYDYSSMFHEYYEGAFPVSADQRRALNDNLISTFYKLAIPFTADALSYRMVMSKSEFERLKTPSEWEDKWGYMDDPLDFGCAGITDNTFFLYAPCDDRLMSNFLLRGMRICYKSFNDAYVDVSFVPWVVFDVLNYDESVKYLLDRVQARKNTTDDEDGQILSDLCFDDPANTYLFKHLTNGETPHKRTLVHRVMTYLHNICLVREFERAFLRSGNLIPHTLPNGCELIRYHYNDRLYREITIIAENTCGKCGDHICPASYAPLQIDEKEHKQLAEALCRMSYLNMDIPKECESIVTLENKLCAQRETRVKKGNIESLNIGKLHPLLCYVDDERYPSDKTYGKSYIALRLVRRSMASFRSALITYKGKNYILNTLFPGEGSSLALVKYYGFIYALHCFVDSDYYSKEREELFYKKWNLHNKSANKKELRGIFPEVYELLSMMSSAFWPSKELIEQAYSEKEKLPDGHDYKWSLTLDNIKEIAEKIGKEIDMENSLFVTSNDI